VGRDAQEEVEKVPGPHELHAAEVGEKNAPTPQQGARVADGVGGLPVALGDEPTDRVADADVATAGMPLRVELVVGTGGDVRVGVPVGVGVGTTVLVGVGEGVPVGNGERVGKKDSVAEGDRVGEPEGVSERVAGIEEAPLTLGVAVAVFDDEGVQVGVTDAVLEAVGVCEGEVEDEDTVAHGEFDAEALREAPLRKMDAVAESKAGMEGVAELRIEADTDMEGSGVCVAGTRRFSVCPWLVLWSHPIAPGGSGFWQPLSSTYSTCVLGSKKVPTGLTKPAATPSPAALRDTPVPPVLGQPPARVVTRCEPVVTLAMNPKRTEPHVEDVK
jgi:hypothetical protein